MPQIDATQLEGEVQRILRVIHADPVRALPLIVDAVDIHEVACRGHHAFVSTRGSPVAAYAERQHLRHVVLEIAPRIAALGGVVVAGEVPIAPIEHAEEAVPRAFERGAWPLRRRRRRRRTAHLPAVIPALRVSACCLIAR